MPESNMQNAEKVSPAKLNQEQPLAEAPSKPDATSTTQATAFGTPPEAEEATSLPAAEPHAGFYNRQLLSQQYLNERRRYSSQLRMQAGSLRRLAGASAVYLLRRMLWSFGFFPVVIAFWLPLVFARFNPVVMIDSLLPAMQSFVQGNPEAQAATMETVLIAWFSIGFAFTVFDLILTPFKSPLEQSTDAHMRLWLALHAPQADAADLAGATAGLTNVGEAESTDR